MTEEVKDKRPRRQVFKKQLFVCKAIDGDDPDKASAFRAVAGPFPGQAEAVRYIRDEAPEGKYVLMHEGRSFTKRVERVTKVVEA